MTQGERRPAGWQRALRWIAWLTFLALAGANSGRSSFGGREFLALAVAVAVSAWCLAKPLGGPKVVLTDPRQVRGTFVSRTNWGLLLFGAILTIGGVGAAGAIVFDMSTGRAGLGDVLRDMAVFIEGWFVEVFTKGAVDAELENTHAYALVGLLLPGLLLLMLNIGPLARRGCEFSVDDGGSVSVRFGDSFEPLLPYTYPAARADGATIAFRGATDAAPGRVLPQQRVFCRENGARLTAELSATFFRRLLTDNGFDVDPAEGGVAFTAARN